MNDALYRLLSLIPADADCAIVIFPKDDKSEIRSFGMSPEYMAELLYRMADEIVDQKIPPPDWRARLGFK